MYRLKVCAYPLAMLALAAPLPTQSATQAGDSVSHNAVLQLSESANDAQSRANRAQLTSSESPDMRIGAGDLLEIKTFGSPELSDTVRVSGRGEVTLPLIGAVKVAGLSPEEAQKTIAERFLRGGYLRDPHVNVLIKEFATQGISVLGEVARPGIYPMLGSRRLFDAISAAGGTTNRAGKTVVIAHRAPGSAPEVITLSRDPAQAARQNVDLQAGDTLTVSRAGIIYVSGDVKMPGGYVMDNNDNLTVLQAIALAQGLNTTASSGNARIIRRSRGQLREIPVELKRIMAAKSPDITLEDEDVLFVPNSASKSAARKSLESIVQVATGLAIYRR